MLDRAETMTKSGTTSGASTFVVPSQAIDTSYLQIRFTSYPSDRSLSKDDKGKA